jgi:hypothetical protein
MIRAAGIFLGVFLILGFAFLRIGQGLGQQLSQSVETGSAPLQYQAQVPKETLEQRRLRHMSYFDPKLYRRTYGVAN